VARRAVIVLALLGLLGAAEPAVGAQVVLPDLRMAKLTTIKLDTTTMPGHRLLRYTATMVNVGAGALEVLGTRPNASSKLTVVQRIYNDDGTFADVSKPIAMQYAGDGHDHWHSLNMEGGRLVKLDNTKVGALAKHGFCFFDNVAFQLTLPGAPAAPVYTSSNSCAMGNPNALNVMMGLSIGWGDMYSAQTNLQWIDITGLPNGTYRLSATADPRHLVSEASYTNNSASARIKITSTGVTVVAYGPGA
jgi:Lysyl oxidase